MEKNKKLNKREAITISCIIIITIILANLIFLNYTNIIHVDFDIGDAVIIGFILYSFIIIFSVFPPNSSIDNKETECNSEKNDNRKI